MAVQAADIDLTGLTSLDVKARQAFGTVVIANTEGNAVNDILEEVTGPENSSFLGEGGQGLEPDGIDRGELIGTATLLHGEDVGFLIKAQADVTTGKAAQEFHESAAVDAGSAFFLHGGGIIAGELDIHVRGHDGERISSILLYGLKPDGAKICGSSLARDDGSGLLETFDDLLFFYAQIHNVFPCSRRLISAVLFLSGVTCFYKREK
jgi:hypothetical protein